MRIVELSEQADKTDQCTDQTNGWSKIDDTLPSVDGIGVIGIEIDQFAVKNGSETVFIRAIDEMGETACGKRILDRMEF